MKNLDNFATGADDKILWCWVCKENIIKGELIYPMWKKGVPFKGRFSCLKCKDNDKSK